MEGQTADHIVYKDGFWEPTFNEKIIASMFAIILPMFR